MTGAEPTRWGRFWGEVMLGKAMTLLLAAAALVVGIATFTLLAGGLSFGVGPNTIYVLVLVSAVLLLLLGAVLAGRVTRVWVDRRRGSAGSRLHVRLVLMFGGVAVVPAILVAVFASFFFSLGIQSWFNDRVRTALHESVQASRGYLEEHRQNIRGDAAGMASDLTNLSPTPMLTGDPGLLAQLLANQTALRGLTMAVLFEPASGSVLASAGAFGSMDNDSMANAPAEKPPNWASDLARSGEVAVFASRDGNEVRALVQLYTVPTLYLMIGRPVDRVILDHMSRTEQAVAEYDRLDQNRSGLQITFALIFALVTLLVLAAATLIGLVLANQIARPIGRLILAAERVRGGDLSVRVPEVRTEDEVAGLSRAFNRMTGQLASQRGELMDAYSQIDERRRFTEAVLSGVSAGVIGLDRQGLITLPNSAASRLLDQDLLAAIGRPLTEVVPEFAPLLEPGEGPRDRTAEVQIGPRGHRRTLLARIGADRPGEQTRGFVVTFDDITELQSAQRKAAWADVARRIAHEIKNPLTPIQLSAERLKRRFTREITSDPETFAQCADTIVRHVGDIGRMVDEFSAFARMPMPVIRPEDLGRIAREAMVLQRAARPEIVWDTRLPDRGPTVACDRRLIGQALTNLLNNAAEAIGMREGAGKISVAIAESDGEGLHLSGAGPFAALTITDDGGGLPEAEERLRLMEPYVTHKPKGTGLGLAIVKKIMEDHGGAVTLDDRADAPGAIARLILPLSSATGSERPARDTAGAPASAP